MAFIKTIGTIVLGPMDSITDEQREDGWFEYAGDIYTFNAWDAKNKKVVEDATAVAEGLKEAIYQLLDAKAREFDYRDMNEVAGFAVRAGEWQAEAQALLDWQTKVWEVTYTALKNPPVGDLTKVLALLPVLNKAN
jgi:hypothetical protein